MVNAMKKFKSKKKSNNLIIYIGLFVISISFSIKYIYEKNLVNKDSLVDFLINDNFNKYKNNINDVDFLLKYALNIDLKADDKVSKIENNQDESTINIEVEEVINEPLVYIYNTHQEEKYNSEYLEVYNINSTVLTASKILKEYLKNEGINSIVEEDSVSDKLHSLNWKYGYSYKVSRMFLESAYNINPSLNYFIDIHRDSSIYERTTTEINGEKYARLLFVIGLDNQNYEKNLAFAEKLKDKIINYNENLFRGIMKKSGKGVNGIYNQDFNPNTILIEVGGQYNNINEVNNSLKVLAKIISEYIKEDLNE